MILPGKYKSGNLLSTLFTLFLGISEKVLVFEKQIFPQNRLLTNRYCKQGFIIIASLLFLLTSFEWPAASASQPLYSIAAKTKINAAAQPAHSSVAFSVDAIGIQKSAVTELVYFPKQNSFNYPDGVYKIFLRVRNIRI